VGGMIEVSDELLMAYVDGQLDKPQSSIVTRLTRDDETLAHRIGSMQQTQTRLLETFGALLREGHVDASRPISANRPQANTRHTSGISLSAGMVSLLLLLGLSLGITGAYYTGFSTASPPMTAVATHIPTANWVEDMAELHAFFTNDTVAVSPESQTNPDVVKFQLAKLSQSLVLPNFSAQGLRFARGQLMTYQGRKLMQLVYTNETEPLVALYISPGETSPGTLPGQFGDVRTISWGTQDLRFVVAANMTHDSLRALAAMVQAQMGGR
jgi:anti-sigma factor RsiW